MALPPLPANNTARYWVDYTANGRAHSAMFRYLEPTPGSEPSVPFRARVASFLSDMTAWLPAGFAVTGARFSPKLSTVSLPATPPAAPSATGVANAAEAPAFASWVGRSPQGRKFRLFLIGVSQAATDLGAGIDYRVLTSEGTVPSATVANLEGWCALGGTDGLYAIDGVVGCNIYNYVNLGFNAYWQREMRP